MKRQSPKYRENKLKVLNWILGGDTRLFFILYFILFIPIIPSITAESSIAVLAAIALMNALFAYLQMSILKIVLYQNRFGTQSIQMLEALKLAKTVDHHNELRVIYTKLIDELKENSYIAYNLSMPFWRDTMACINEFTRWAQEQENINK